VCREGRCPSIDSLEDYTPRQTSKLYAVDNRFIAEIGLERRTLVKLGDVPKTLRDAFVITEDKRFYSHAGIDWRRVFGAGLRNIRAGGLPRSDLPGEDARSEAEGSQGRARH
jgi:penicillin-binding protein 1A